MMVGEHRTSSPDYFIAQCKSCTIWCKSGAVFVVDSGHRILPPPLSPTPGLQRLHSSFWFDQYMTISQICRWKWWCLVFGSLLPQLFYFWTSTQIYKSFLLPQCQDCTEWKLSWIPIVASPFPLLVLKPGAPTWSENWPLKPSKW